MPIIIAEGKKFYFAHVPKVGGSSVVDYLTRRFGGPLGMNDSSFQQKAGLRDTIISPQHMTARYASVMLTPDVEQTFAIVRDPLSRMLSQYRFQAGISKMSRLGFSTWLRIVLGAARLDPRIYDNHIRPQTDLVPEDATVFHMENRFTDMIGWLDDVTGLPAPDIEMGHLLKRQRDPVSVLRQDAMLVADYYRADYDRFGYERPDFQSFQSDPYHTLRGFVATCAAPALVKWQHRKWLR